MEGPLLRPLPFRRQRSGGLTMDQNAPPLSDGYHTPVMVDRVIELLAPAPPGLLVDATFGGGGHTAALLRAFPDRRMLAVDRDVDAISQVPEDPRIHFVTANFNDLGRVLQEATSAGGQPDGEDDPRHTHVAGVLFDLGVSSHQLDVAARGFSYHQEGPLDMRMGPDATTTADAVVNTWPVAELARIFDRYSDERFSRRIATAIERARPISTTTQLAAIIADAVPAPARRKRHPARRAFQAIRIAVNDELSAIGSGIEAAIASTRLGGRIVVISYHSLEARIVKRRFNEGSAGCTCPPDLPVCTCGRAAELRLLARKGLRPDPNEIELNPRARSALLRAAERVSH